MSTATLQIDSAAELFAALGAPDVPTRLGLLRAVAAQPGAIAACRDAQGRDVLDWLLAQLAHDSGDSLRLALLGAIAAFDDDRVVQAFAAMLPSEWDAEAIALIATRLWPCRDTLAREPLAKLLLSGEPSPLMRAAALLLSDREDLSTAEHLRLCLLGEPGDFALPAVDDASLAAWLAELNGPLTLSARGDVESLGQPAATALLCHWPRLDPACTAWLIAWSSRVAPHAASAHLPDWLSSPATPVRVAALWAVSARPAWAVRCQEAVRDSLSHAEPAVRRAAAAAADDRIPWHSLIVDETDLDVVGDLLRRLAAARGAASLPDLAAAMVHADWSVRSVAAELLATLGEAAVPLARELCGHTRAEVRLAAARALVALGDDAWLDEELDEEAA